MDAPLLSLKSAVRDDSGDLGDRGERGICGRDGWCTSVRSAWPRRDGVAGACGACEVCDAERLANALERNIPAGGDDELSLYCCQRLDPARSAAGSGTHLEFQGDVVMFPPFQAHHVHDPPAYAVDPLDVVLASRPDLDAVDLRPRAGYNTAHDILRVEHFADQCHGQVCPDQVEQVGRGTEEQYPLSAVCISRILPHLLSATREDHKRTKLTGRMSFLNM